jgi:hypothetical protein
VKREAQNMSQLAGWIKNIGKWIEGVLKGNPPERVPVKVPVRR